MDCAFCELRADGESGAWAGRLITFGERAKIGRFTEAFAPDSIRMDDPIANIQHDRTKPVARAGAGLEVRAVADGIDIRLDPPDTVHGRACRELLESRVLRGLSMEFRAEKERWEGRNRTILRATVSGLGIVDKPAYRGSVFEQRYRAATAPAQCRRDLL